MKLDALKLDGPGLPGAVDRFCSQVCTWMWR
jgi:hypothetical protein